MSWQAELDELARRRAFASGWAADKVNVSMMAVGSRCVSASKS